MQIVNKCMMFAMNVSDMPKAKAFYADKLGLEITADYRQDDDNWWVTFAFPDGGATITLARASSSPESVEPGTIAIYLETSDVEAAHKELIDKGVTANEVQDDLFGPGSGVKFFIVTDPDGNRVHVVQAHAPRAPF